MARTCLTGGLNASTPFWTSGSPGGSSTGTSTCSTTTSCPASASGARPPSSTPPNATPSRRRTWNTIPPKSSFSWSRSPRCFPGDALRQTLPRQSNCHFDAPSGTPGGGIVLAETALSGAAGQHQRTVGKAPYFTLSIRLSAWTGESVKWSWSLTCKMRKIQPPAGSKRAIIKAAKHRKGALFMKIFFYTLRPWDERPCAERLAAETGIAFDGCEAYPTLENAALAAGCDAVSMTPCDMGPDMVRRFHELGVKYLCCRS